MATTQESTVILDFGDAVATERKRTSSRGTKSRYTLDVRSDRVTIGVDPKQLGAPVANAIAAAVRGQIEAIQAPASVDTQLKRTYGEAALRRGARWAKKRYSGGKTGQLKPNGAGTTGRLFNDSGRFARGIVARATSSGTAGQAGYTINVPANRLDPSTFTPAQFEAMLRRLVELVPALGTPGELARLPEVADAIRDATAAIVQKGTASAVGALLGAARETVSQVAELGEALGTITEE